MTDEEFRILIAVDERRLFRNAGGRFEIDGEERPDYRTRERLRTWRWIVPIYERGGPRSSRDGYRITPTGKAALAAELAAREASG